MFTGRLRSEIPPSLRSLSSAMIIAGTQLIELDLSDNAFGPDGAEAIRSLLTSPVAYTIQTLKFQNNGLGGGGVVSKTSFLFLSLIFLVSRETVNVSLSILTF